MRTVWIVMLALTAPAVAAPTASSTLAGVQSYYAKAPQLTAKFKQQVTYATFGTSNTTSGNVYVKKPGDVRWDYLRPDKKVSKSFMYDGTTLWLVDNDSMQVMKQAVSGSAMPAAVAFLTGGNLTSQFNVALDTSGTYGGAGATVLALTPKQPSAGYQRVFFVVADDGHVRESIVIASNGDVNDIQLFTPDTTTAVPTSLFTVAPGALPGYKRP
jgi:outer membrane lipoprotein carrier protein